MDARRSRDCRDSGARLFHPADRRVGRDDSVDGRPDAVQYLVGARYSERTSIGLVTVSGSIGLLFFPSLPVFLYSFYAGVPVDRLFVAALIPGIVLVAVVAGWAASRGWWRGATRTPFEWREAAGGHMGGKVGTAPSGGRPRRHPPGSHHTG